jgi:hypothetical protein
MRVVSSPESKLSDANDDVLVVLQLLLQLMLYFSHVSLNRNHLALLWYESEEK